MLVLSRKCDQKIQIGDSIEVAVLSIDGSSVKLGITAPEQVKVLRGELWDAILEQEAIARQLASGESEPDSFSQLRELLVDESGIPAED